MGNEAAMRDWAAELVERADNEGADLISDNRVVDGAGDQVLQTAWKSI